MKDDTLTLYAMLFVAMLIGLSSIYIRFQHPDMSETQLFLYMFWGIYD